MIALLVILASPWAWQVRAQTLALPLFTGLLWLLIDHQHRLDRRVLLALPILIVWGNVHGTAVMAAILVMGAGAIDLIRRRGDARVAVALVLAAPVCLLVSPYALDLPSYYHLMLVDPPFKGLIVEWRPTRPEAKTVLFFALTVVTAVLAVWQRRRLTLFEGFALALTFWVGIDAIRGVTWFVLTVLIVVPALLDGALRMKPAQPHRGANVVISAICLVGLSIGVVLTAAQPTKWFESTWPTEALPAIAEVTGSPADRVRHLQLLGLALLASARPARATCVRHSVRDLPSPDDPGDGRLRLDPGAELGEAGRRLRRRDRGPEQKREDDARARRGWPPTSLLRRQHRRADPARSLSLSRRAKARSEHECQR